ncbi:MAG: hypothetical protein QOJ01_2417, partial [Solirubrobacterales bacterium]|nr:hypothetical protein [Solirubrobacterales bacterium]
MPPRNAPSLAIVTSVRFGVLTGGGD